MSSDMRDKKKPSGSFEFLNVFRYERGEGSIRFFRLPDEFSNFNELRKVPGLHLPTVFLVRVTKFFRTYTGKFSNNRQQSRIDLIIHRKNKREGKTIFHKFHMPGTGIIPAGANTITG